MLVYRYDDTFEGLLSAVFEAYRTRRFPDRVIGASVNPPLFTEECVEVATDREHAGRVWTALRKKLGRNLSNMVTHLWLSEVDGADDLLFRYIRKVFDHREKVYLNFADPEVLRVKQIAQKVSKEGHYMRQFIRFQKGGDQTFFAAVSPDCNALPLTVNYLRERFADQKWIVYDTRRNYGYYYDLKKVIEISFEEMDFLNEDGKVDEKLLAEDEKLFQQLWKNYFKALTIKERINPSLHRKNMPRRFWKYLTEKQL